MMITIVQFMAVAYFIAAVRMKFWRTSMNTFVVLSAVFLIAILSNFEYYRLYWVDLHLSIVAFTLTFMMARVVYQRYVSKVKDCLDMKCKGCPR